MLNRVFLGKFIKEYPVSSLGKDLNEKINNILTKAREKEQNGEIDKKELKAFLGNLSRMELNNFDANYEILDSLLSHNRDEIKESLKIADEILDIGVFAAKKVDATTFEQHVFSLADAASFITNLSSKIGLCSIERLNRVSKNDYPSFLILLESIEENDTEVIDSLLEPYRDWYSRLEGNDNEIVNTIYNVLKNNEDVALNMLTRYLKKINKKSTEIKDKDVEYLNYVFEMHLKRKF